MDGRTVVNQFLQGANLRLPAWSGVTGSLENCVVLPRGGILSRDPATRPLAVRADALTSSGVLLQRRYEQTRSADGRIATWVARSKGAGRDEVQGGLAYDSIKPVDSRFAP